MAAAESLPPLLSPWKPIGPLEATLLPPPPCTLAGLSGTSAFSEASLSAEFGRVELSLSSGMTPREEGVGRWKACTGGGSGAAEREE